MVHCPQLRVMFLAECPSHASVEQSLQNLSLKHPDFELQWRSRSTVDLSADIFEARSSESGPSFDLRVDVVVLVDNAAQVDETIRLFVLLAGSFDNQRLKLGLLVWCPKQHDLCLLPRHGQARCLEYSHNDRPGHK